MGNKKGRLRRNRKANNWRAMRNRKKKQVEISNIESDTNLSIKSESSQSSESNFGETDDFPEHGTIKRRRMTDCQEETEIFTELYKTDYALLEDTEERNEHENSNEADEFQENCAVKYETITDLEEETEIFADVCESYYAILDDDDDERNVDGNSNESQQYDPISIDDDEDNEMSDDGEAWMDGWRENLCGEDEGDSRETDVEEGEEGCDPDINDEDEGNSGSEADNLLSADDDEEDVIREAKLTGRRIFDIAELFKMVQSIGRHSKNCHFEDMILIGEVKRGLNSIFKFQCNKCGTIRKMESCPKNKKSMGVNNEAVLGINCIGSGFFHLQEFLAQVDVSCMSASTYDKISKKHQTDWYTLAKQSANTALLEEIRLAIEAGDVDSKGNALIAVICDGGWGKRSYGKKFNSLSGCAVLVGVRTKKVVFFGVRNKYCHICKLAEKNITPVREHECNINYRGPSSGMEADIILEGFQESEQSGARYHKLIADGDSSTYKVLRDFRLYKDPDLVIEKLECVNHLCRNFRSKFGFLEKVTKFDKKLRKHVKPSKANDICKGVKSAAKHWRDSNVSLSQKLNNLERDIMNAPAHYFGVHTKCKSYFCSKTTSRAAIDNLNLLKSDGLYYEVLNLCQVYFAGNVKSLLENQTNNPAEQFNNVVAKYLGGKRINYSLARSYTGRVASAVVQYNSEGHAASTFRQFKLGGDDLPSSSLTLENSRKRKLVANAIALETNPRDRHPKEVYTANGYHHGVGSEDVDMPPDQLEKCTKIFLEKLQKRQDNRIAIERQTTDKKFSEYWHQIRQDLLPTSHFFRILKAVRRDSYTNILQEIMYNRSEFGNNAQIKHERLVERDALVVFENLFPDEEVTECGLFIDKEFCFLCASPFRLYGNTHILSIKCPVKEYGKKFEQVIPKMKFFKTKGKDVTINQKSDWYIEIQGDMRVVDRKFAYLMIWLGEDNYRIIEVARNDMFFQQHMKEKLAFFYNECMLKELVDPRVNRHMKLRTFDPEKMSFV